MAKFTLSIFFQGQLQRANYNNNIIFTIAAKRAEDHRAAKEIACNMHPILSPSSPKQIHFIPRMKRKMFQKKKEWLGSLVVNLSLNLLPNLFKRSLEFQCGFQLRSWEGAPQRLYFRVGGCGRIYQCQGPPASCL